MTRRRGGTSTRWAILRVAVLTRADQRCQAPGPDGTPCGRPAPIRAAHRRDSGHAGHIIPFALGGPDTPDNLRAECPDCSRRAGGELAERLRAARRATPDFYGRRVLGREVGSSRVDLQACKLEYSIVSPK